MTEPAPPRYGMLIAMELAEMGANIRGERFRREHPGADEAEVRACIQAWWLERPGAPFGDAVGRPVTI